MTLRIPLLLLLLAPAAYAKHPVRPPSLREGDTVAIVAPAARLALDTDTARVRARFAEWGLCVRFGDNIFDQSHPYLAGSDSIRAADLQAAIDNPSVKAIIAYRGGYGSMRLLPYLNLSVLRHSPKWIVGFSDITTLHLALAKVGVETIHGAMPTRFLFRQDTVDGSAERLRDALMGRLDTLCVAPHPLNRVGEATGVVMGGNLTMIMAALATDEQMEVKRPTLLLLEEVGEEDYRLDRMMQQLQRTGMLEQVTGVIVGHFTASGDGARFGKPYEILDRYLGELGIPIVYGFPSGHEEPNASLYLGRSAHLTVTGGGAQLDYR